MVDIITKSSKINNPNEPLKQCKLCGKKVYSPCKGKKDPTKGCN